VAEIAGPMLFTLIFLVYGPILFLIASGLLSVYLTFSGYIPGRTRIGWTLLGVTLAVFFPIVAWTAGTETAGVGALFYILFLSMLLALQAPLFVELITLIPDRSKGLKLLKVHTEAEKKVNQDDLPGAIEEYEKTIAADPLDFDARLRLAELCCENKQYQKAAAAYENFLKKADKLEMGRHCSVLTRLSEIYAEHLGKVEKARGLIRIIIEKYPTTKYARYANDRLQNL